MAILGIDPGLNGGIVAIDGLDVVYQKVMPTFNRKDYDLGSILDLLSDPSVEFICMEKVKNISGAKISQSSTFKFGEGFGILRALIYASRVPHSLVEPQKWQKPLHLGINKKMGPKDRSLQAAERYFPGHSFKLSPGSKKPHDGLVDAALIALYGARYVLNGEDPDEIKVTAEFASSML